MEVTRSAMYDIRSSEGVPITYERRWQMPEELLQMRCVDLLCKHTWGERSRMGEVEGRLYDARFGSSNWSCDDPSKSYDEKHLCIISNMERDGYRNAVRIIQCNMPDGSSRLICDNLHTMIRYIREIGLDAQLCDVPFYLACTDGSGVHILTDGRMFREDMTALDGIARAALLRYRHEAVLDCSEWTIGGFLKAHYELLGALPLELAGDLSDGDLLAIYNAIQQRIKQCGERDNWGRDYWRNHDLNEMIQHRDQWWALKNEGCVQAAVRIIPWDAVGLSTKEYLRAHPDWNHEGCSYALQLISLERGAGAELLRHMPARCVGDVLVNDSTVSLVRFYEQHEMVSFVGYRGVSDEKELAESQSLLVEIEPGA